MNKDKANRKIAEWLGVCWHEFLLKMICPVCDKCGNHIEDVEWDGDGIPNCNPDYYTPEGFFALLDGLTAKGLESDLRQKFSDNEWEVDVWVYESPSVPDIMATARHTNLPTALVKATLQAMEAE